MHGETAIHEANTILRRPPRGKAEPAVAKTSASTSNDDERVSHLVAVLAHSNDAIISKSLDGIIRSWNASAERLFGYTEDEAVGKSITMLIPPERLHEEATILETIRGGGRVEDFETERVHRDGHRMPVSLAISPIRDGHGQIIGSSKIVRDIAARLRAKAEIAENQRQLWAEAQGMAILNDWSSKLWGCSVLAEGMEHILDAMIELARADKGNIQLREGTVLHFAAQRGFDQTFLDVFREVSERDESGCARAMRLCRRVIISDTETDPAYAPYREVARRAGYRTVVSVPLLESSDEVLGVVTVQFRDVHVPGEPELRRMELCARQASDFIRRCRVEQQLRDADRHKDAFLAVLAHELRNPLAPIRTGVHLLKMVGADAPAHAQAVAVIDRQSEHMMRLVDDLLDVSRIGLGKIALELRPLDLRPVLMQASETSRPLIDAAGHRLVLDVPLVPACVCGDPVRLAQVFMNLLNNAARYTPRGGTVTLRLQADDDKVIVCVSDTGKGIDSSMLERLFDLYVQAEPGNREGGLGIGLSLVRSLVHLHGGSIQAHSEGIGKGSRFTVCLPAHVDPSAPCEQMDAGDLHR